MFSVILQCLYRRPDLRDESIYHVSRSSTTLVYVANDTVVTGVTMMYRMTTETVLDETLDYVSEPVFTN